MANYVCVKRKDFKAFNEALKVVPCGIKHYKYLVDAFCALSPWPCASPEQVKALVEAARNILKFNIQVRNNIPAPSIVRLREALNDIGEASDE